MATILGALQNAQYNLTKNSYVPLARAIGEDQLHNAIVLLEKGYGVHSEIEDVIKGYDTVEEVPPARKTPEDKYPNW